MDHNPTWQKTVSWLVVSFIMIAACVWLSSGSLMLGIVASATATPVKVVVYFVHEYVWGKYIFGR
jgi:uncharacterized membrane protein